MDNLVKKKDIFDDMHIIIRCEYISDLRQHQLMVLYELGRMNLSSYSQENLEDFSRYVFGVGYGTLKQMMKDGVNAMAELRRMYQRSR